MKTFNDDVAVVGKENEGPTENPSAVVKTTVTGTGRSTIPPFITTSYDKFSTSPFADTVRTNKGLSIGIAAAVILIGAYLMSKTGVKPAAPAFGPVPVTVQTLTQKPVQLWSEFSGHTQAVDFAEIRPEVSGRITEVRFQDGQIVNKGDVLFVIDPAPYQAALDQAQANATFAKTELERADGLVKAQAIAQRLFDERQSASLVADAQLARARVDYDRAFVKAPISGRISRAEITVGNLVQTGPNAPLLTSIVSDHGIYADFEVDEQTYLESIRGDALGADQEHKIPVELTVQGDAARIYKGTIYSFDNHIDNVSGTIRARAKFANLDGSLMPGMFVSVRVGTTSQSNVLLVPEQAVSIDQNKKFVYVVGKDNKVIYREVTLGRQSGSDRVVLSGLAAGDRVIIDGIQHVRPDVTVAPTEVAPDPATPASPAVPANSN